jgi:hypothetical protein
VGLDEGNVIIISCQFLSSAAVVRAGEIVNEDSLHVRRLAFPIPDVIEIKFLMSGQYFGSFPGAL